MKSPGLRRVWTTVCLSMALLVVVGCGGGGGQKKNPVGQVLGAVVASSDSSPVAGATVSIGSLSVQTGADGRYALDDVAAGDRVVLTVQAAGFLDGIRAVPVGADQATTANVRLVRAGTETAVDPTVDSVATDAGSSARVALGANTLVDAATGAAPVGAVTVRVTAIDPGADPQSMPGDFTTSAGDRIESFGAVNVTLSDANGARLDLKAGSVATLRIPLATRSANPPATIPLFYMDEATGRWVEEGSATLVESGAERYYEGTVAHFTTWNADQRQETIFVKGCVVTDAGQPVTEAIANSVGVDYAGSAAVAVDPQGRFSVPMRKGSRASIYAEGANTSNTVVAGPSEADIDLPACLVIGSAAVAPTIVDQPASYATQVGGFAIFSVVATGTRPLTYQWRRDGVPVAGARGDALLIAAVNAADDGAVFDVVVANAAGSVTSQGAVLSVAAPVAPAIAVPPAPVTVAAGASASFSVTATGTPPLTYQWQRDGADIAGATAATYTLPVTALADSGAVFRVRVANVAGEVVSNGAALTVTGPVLSAPTITEQPQDATVAVGQTATFSVAVTGSPAPAFQWLRNGGPIAGATASSYTTPPAEATDDGASFSVQVSNSQGSVTSQAATLTVTSITSEQKVALTRTLFLAFEFASAGLLPFEAVTDDSLAFLNPATVCDSGNLSVTLGGAAVSPGQAVPASGTIAGTGLNCEIDGVVFNGSTSIAYAFTSRNPEVGTATMTVSGMRVTSSFFDGSSTVVEYDVTANGSAALSINTQVAGADTVYDAALTPAAGATLRNELSGVVATFSSGSVSSTLTEDTATGDPKRTRLSYDNLAFTVGGASYVGSGSIEFVLAPVPGGSGEVVLNSGGVQVGRIFFDVDGQMKIEVDGVVQPF